MLVMREHTHTPVMLGREAQDNSPAQNQAALFDERPASALARGRRLRGGHTTPPAVG